MARWKAYGDRERMVVMVEVGLTVALATVLGFLKLWEMPQGGSISLSMLPLFVLALRRGPVPGIAAGALYGVVDAMLEPYVVHWIQFLLDYPLAFAAVGIAGFGAVAMSSAFKNGRPGKASAIIVGSVALGALGRYVAHVISGAVFFAEYATGPVVAYSLAYNSFVLISAAVCAAAAIAILPVLSRVIPVSQRSSRS